MKIHPFVSAVVYVHNAKQTIETFLTKIDDYFGENFESYEIILVDDQSTDQTIRLIEKIIPKIKSNVILVHLARYHKIENALLSGLDMAIGDFVYEFESTEISYPLTLIRDLYEKAIRGFDIVGATPHKKRISSKFFYKLLDTIAYFNLNMETETFRLVTRRALNAAFKKDHTIFYRKALYRLSGFPSSLVTYNPINKETKHGTLIERFSLALSILVSFSNVGLRIAFVFSFIFLAFSIVGGLYTIYSYFTLDYVLPGWTTLMLFLALGFSGLFLVLGVISKYLGVILLELMDHPIYTVKSIGRFAKKE